ncbi:MAG: hypothetical protein GXY44_00880, partial [Phycisphaerales bacterium]|nr:hypothetical protein [Phycisphaerales bacterium]
MLDKSFGGAGERFGALLEAYGILGVAVLVILVLICINYMLIRGAGLTFLLLMVSYSLSFTGSYEGGLGLATFFMRILCLVALFIGAVKHISIPGWPFVVMFGYVFLGLLFMPLSENVMWSFQKSMLLLVAFLGCTLGGA